MNNTNYKQIGKDTWQFEEELLGAEVYCYLLVGRDRAMLIDTAYGFTDLASAVSEITSLPVFVVNSHGHFDHITGNYQFEEVYISRKESDVYKRHRDPEYIEQLLCGIMGCSDDEDNNVKSIMSSLKRQLDHEAPVPKPLPDSGYFDLGGRRIRVIETPGHTAGSISLLDETNGWLFAADTCCRDGVLLQFPESTSAECFHKSIETLKGLADQGAFDLIYPGHQVSPLNTSILDLYDRNCTVLLNGELPHSAIESSVYTDKKLAISFDPKRIWEER